MIRCSRCDQPVDETAVTSCPFCYTPILPQEAASEKPEEASSAPAPIGLAGGMAAAPIPMRSATPPPPTRPLSPLSSPSNPGTRVSLTGEVIESAMPPQATNQPMQPGGYAGGSLGGSPPTSRPGSPSATARTRESSASAKSSSGNVAGIAAAIVVIFLVCFGGWWYMQHRTNPKGQAEKVINAFKTQDWKALYELTEMTADQKAKYPDFATWDADRKQSFEKVPGGEQVVESIAKSIDSVSIGEPTFEDGKASVPVSFSITLMGLKADQKQTFPMKNIGGIWKLDGDAIGGIVQGGANALGGR